MQGSLEKEIVLLAVQESRVGKDQGWHLKGMGKWEWKTQLQEPGPVQKWERKREESNMGKD